MMKSRLVGGSAGLKLTSNDTSYGPKIPQLGMFLQKGLFPTILKNNIKGYILPSFDSTLSNFDLYKKSSYESYRDSSVQDPTTGFDVFTSWFVPLGSLGSGDKDSKFVTSGGVYQYFCNSKSTFISPTINADSPKYIRDILETSTGDPIRDLRIYIGTHKDKDPAMLEAYNKYVVKPIFNRDNPRDTPIWALPTPKMGYLVNAYCTGSNPYAEDYTEMKNRVLLITSMTFTELLNDLDKYGPGTMKSIDPDYPDFLYGDITNPKRALMFTGQTINANISYTKLNFGTYNPRTGLVCNQTDLTAIPGVLEGRYNLTDTQNVVKIPTYDEVVKLLIDEGVVPYNLIALVCAYHCEEPFPENPDIVPQVSSTNTVADKEDNLPGLEDAPVWTPPATNKVASKTMAYNDPVAHYVPAQEKTVTPTAPISEPSKPEVIHQSAVTSTTLLTPEEFEEFKKLHAIMQVNGASMTVDQINTYGSLFKKGGSELIALVSK